MKLWNEKQVSRKVAILGLLTLMSNAGVPSVSAHETDCPRCKLKVVQDTEAQDNEVALRYGRKRIEYRSVGCAIADVQGGVYKNSDITILAPSEVKGKPVPVMRTGGTWQAPAGVVFVGASKGHDTCHIAERAFTSDKAFAAYVKNFPELKSAKPLTLEQFVAAQTSQPKTK